MNTREVWVVLAGDDYYPSWNNIKLITNNYDRACEYGNQLYYSGDYDWVEIDKEDVEIV